MKDVRLQKEEFEMNLSPGGDGGNGGGSGNGSGGNGSGGSGSGGDDPG